MVEHWLRGQLNNNEVGKYDKVKRREVMGGVRSSDPANLFYLSRLEFLAEIINEIMRQSYLFEENKRPKVGRNK